MSTSDFFLTEVSRETVQSPPRPKARPASAFPVGHADAFRSLPAGRVAARGDSGANPLQPNDHANTTTDLTSTVNANARPHTAPIMGFHARARPQSARAAHGGNRLLAALDEFVSTEVAELDDVSLGRIWAARKEAMQTDSSRRRVKVLRLELPKIKRFKPKKKVVSAEGVVTFETDSDSDHSSSSSSDDDDDSDSETSKKSKGAKSAFTWETEPPEGQQGDMERIKRKQAELQWLDAQQNMFFSEVKAMTKMASEIERGLAGYGLGEDDDDAGPSSSPGKKTNSAPRVTLQSDAKAAKGKEKNKENSSGKDAAAGDKDDGDDDEDRPNPGPSTTGNLNSSHSNNALLSRSTASLSQSSSRLLPQDKAAALERRRALTRFSVNKPETFEAFRETCEEFSRKYHDVLERQRKERAEQAKRIAERGLGLLAQREILSRERGKTSGYEDLDSLRRSLSGPLFAGVQAQKRPPPTMRNLNTNVNNNNNNNNHRNNGQGQGLPVGNRPPAPPLQRPKSAAPARRTYSVL